MANFSKDTNEKFECQMFDRKRFIFDFSVLKRRKIFFFLNILSGLHHRTDQMYNMPMDDLNLF